MNHSGLDPDLDRLGDALRAATAIDLARESRATYGSAPARPRRRLLAGGTLGLAGAATALVLALGGSTAAPALAITHDSDGSVLVNINSGESLPAANHKLTAMGIGEQVTIYMASGRAATSGPVICTPGRGAGQPRPPVKVLIGKNGTEVLGGGQSAGNTGAGTFHLDHCTVAPTSDTGPGTGNTGNTGNG